MKTRLNNFIHLHVHSEYSLLDGSIRIKELVKQAKDFDMPAVAITDNGVMYGAINFYLQAKSMGIKPIIGCEMYLTPDITKKERGFDRLILLAKNYQGYQNLIKLVTIANLEGFYYKPRIDLNHLNQYHSDLIAISPAMKGPVGYQIQSNENQKAEEYAQKLKNIYNENFYLGLQSLKLPMEDFVKEETLLISKKLNIPLVATNDAYYLKRKNAASRTVLSCIQTGRLVEESMDTQTQSQEMYLKSSEEMIELFKDIPEAIENTIKIADECNVKIETERVHLPHFECPDNKSNEEYLEEFVWQGLKSKYKTITDQIKTRVEFELNTIKKMGYAVYFLIIHDFLNFCRKKNIPVGPGRGSAAGSIVAYGLDITNVDPLEYKLLFERFLNPDRISMPDIDLDFCIKRRGEVIDYIIQKYGEDCVAQIATFGTMAARGVVRDVGRVLGIPLSDVDMIAKLIPSTPGNSMSIHEAIGHVPDLKKLYENNKSFKKLLDTGAELEGLARHTSTHAAGVVISRDPLNTVVPLIKNEGQTATQYPMGDLEKIGLLKMDILGLRNLTVIDETLKLVEKLKNIKLDFKALDVTDQKTYELLGTGQTMGIFQLESRGMRELIKQIKPKVFEDLIAILALYRPGPLGSGMVQDYISNKSGKTNVKYALPSLEPILKDTHGMIVYQEQVMQIASAVGGFSLAQSDMLRRAMGKKKKAVMDKMKTDFIKGAQAKDIPEKTAENIFALCYKFAEYGFNKSHSAAYALISFQTAYLKAHFPCEYFAALLSSVVGNSDKLSDYIAECHNLGITVLGPDINESFAGFTVTPKGIRFGLAAIKNVGEGAIESIVENRKNNPYISLYDFCLKVDLKQTNKRVLECLIKAGAFDQISNRVELLNTYEKMLDYSLSLAREKSAGQIGLFSTGQEEKHITDCQTENKILYSPHELLIMEKELLSIYISGHPLDNLKKKLDSLEYNTSNLKPDDEDKIITLIGILTNCKKIITKNKKEMITARIEDLKGSLPVLLFQGKYFEKLSDMFIDETIVQFKGKVRVREDEYTLFCEELLPIDNKSIEQLHFNLDILDDPKTYQKIKGLMKQKKGSNPVFIHLNDTTIRTHQKYWVKIEDSLLKELKTFIGTSYVWIV
ncbi:DNA polymerase III subunit alpha [Candidatus Margulisiibacteriota bacterium]